MFWLLIQLLNSTFSPPLVDGDLVYSHFLGNLKELSIFKIYHVAFLKMNLHFAVWTQTAGSVAVRAWSDKKENSQTLFLNILFKKKQKNSSPEFQTICINVPLMMNSPITSLIDQCYGSYHLSVYLSVWGGGLGGVHRCTKERRLQSASLRKNPIEVSFVLFWKTSFKALTNSRDGRSSTIVHCSFHEGGNNQTHNNRHHLLVVSSFGEFKSNQGGCWRSQPSRGTLYRFKK